MKYNAFIPILYEKRYSIYHTCSIIEYEGRDIGSCNTILTFSDESVSPDELFKREIIDPDLYELLANYSMRLYNRGVERAAEKGMIFVDTKYEFGIYDGKIMLMDEVNTPDSSRYWIAESYQNRFEQGKEPIKLDKEFLREWLANQGFTGDGDAPKLTDKVRIDVAEKYITLAEKFIGEPLKLDVGSTFDSIKSVVDPFDTF